MASPNETNGLLREEMMMMILDFDHKKYVLNQLKHIKRKEKL